MKDTIDYVARKKKETFKQKVDKFKKLTGYVIASIIASGVIYLLLVLAAAASKPL